MGYASERKLIEVHFQSSWKDGAGDALTPVVFDLQSGDFEDTEEPWVRLSILSGIGEQMTVGAPGNNLHRHAGIVAIQINTPVGSGSEESRTLADKVEAVFMNVTLENLKFAIPFPSGTAEVNNDWSCWTMWCPFTRDELNA